ncbi:Serpentine Receptor, class J [Caenorhabditis elegans]|uniref:Serpentine Receptor, class J n=1 Tax=Caenorhabditis elegans TaxID=6239 RepID=O16986_CAEEL|nr:Serpentine Receptor, class J [Caenorhabditis elegans]CCD71817.1 Serpentine Receptor, class J [Caenorhabditis elegans]|eukprot:NP_503769.1 Serpentine Receptor, class J [Caenorhabditis elegans]
MFEDWIYKYLPRTFCALTFLVNPIFIYLIFSEKSSKFGNYRYLLLYFAIFNLLYSIMNVLVPLDIHTFGYSFFLIVRHGWFQTEGNSSQLNFHMLIARTSSVSSSYAVLMSHFIYRYLVISDSSLTRHHFHWFMTGSVYMLFAYFSVWHATCYFPGKANSELLEYVSEDFQENFGMDSRNLNVIGTLFSVGSHETTLRAWTAMSIWSTISIASIITFFVMAGLVMRKLRKMTVRTSQKTSQFQFELLRALIVQTVTPICFSFSPCLLCWYSPIFGIKLDRWLNYLEVTALGLFSFMDPIAIILCLPIFRYRIFNVINCIARACAKNQSDNDSKRENSTQTINLRKAISIH